MYFLFEPLVPTKQRGYATSSHSEVVRPEILPLCKMCMFQALSLNSEEFPIKQKRIFLSDLLTEKYPTNSLLAILYVRMFHENSLYSITF